MLRRATTNGDVAIHLVLAKTVVTREQQVVCFGYHIIRKIQSSSALKFEESHVYSSTSRNPI